MFSGKYSKKKEENKKRLVTHFIQEQWTVTTLVLKENKSTSFSFADD